MANIWWQTFDGKQRVVYVGPRGGQYILISGKYRSLKNLPKSGTPKKPKQPKQLKDPVKKATKILGKKYIEVVETTIKLHLSDDNIEEQISAYENMDFHDDFGQFCDYYGLPFDEYGEDKGGKMSYAYIVAMKKLLMIK